MESLVQTVKMGWHAVGVKASAADDEAILAQSHWARLKQLEF